MNASGHCPRALTYHSHRSPTACGGVIHFWCLDKGVHLKAAEISEIQKQQVRERLKRSKLPTVASEVDIYEAKAAEILLFDDGIQVKEQKAKRDKQAIKQKSRVNTDVAMLQKRDGTYQYLIAGISEQGEEIFSLQEAIQAEIKSEYSRRKTPLPMGVS